MSNEILQVRKEIGLQFKSLSPETKSKYISQHYRAEKYVGLEAKFLTRCTPDRLVAMVSELADEQK